MPYWVMAVVVLGATTVAGLLAWLVRRAVPVDALRRHHEMGAAVFLQLGVVFAVLLAFVFNEAWSEYNAAAEAINRECGSLHGAAILAESLPAPAREQMERAIRDYITAVITVEWKAMALRKNDRPAYVSFETMLTTAARLPSATESAAAVKPQIISLLTQAHQQRETRLFQLTLGIPGLIWSLLSLFSLVLIGFLFVFGIDYIASQIAFVAVFAALLSLALLTVSLLDYPFEGPLRLPPADFQATLVKVDRLIAADPVAR